MVVIIGVTLLFVPGLLHPSKSQRVQPVDYTDYVIGFRQVTGLAAVTPHGLPTGWYPNSARLLHHGATATLYIGWVSPTQKYAALYESNQTPQRIGGTGNGERAVSRSIGTIRVIVTGSASARELDQLMASLRS
jgi:hypothetical protein